MPLPGLSLPALEQFAGSSGATGGAADTGGGTINFGSYPGASVGGVPTWVWVAAAVAVAVVVMRK